MILELTGGLGNQLFEYAAARYIQLHTGEPIYLNLDSFHRDPQRDYSLGHYLLNEQVKMLPKWKQMLYGNYIELMGHVWHRMGLTRGEAAFQKMAKRGMLFTFDVYPYYSFDVTWKGYYLKSTFQSERYFPKMQDVLRKELALTEPLSEENERMKEKIRTTESVCVHIRRGDYITNPKDQKALNICDEAYYRAAMDYVRLKIADPVFYIFSNTSEDLNWIRENMHLTGELVYVDLRNADYEELALMQSCKHFIISNSTYSWWAQYLAEHPEKIVVAPSTWYRGDDQDATDIYQDDWHMIETTE